MFHYDVGWESFVSVTQIFSSQARVNSNQHNANSEADVPSKESLLTLVKPELSNLSHHWLAALKVYTIVCSLTHSLSPLVKIDDNDNSNDSNDNNNDDDDDDEMIIIVMIIIMMIIVMIN